MQNLLQRIPYTAKDFAWVKWTPENIKVQAHKALESQKEANETVKKIKDEDLTFDNSVYFLERAGARFSRIVGAIDMLMSVSPDKKIREAAKSALDVIQEKIVDIEHDYKVYEKIKAYADKNEPLGTAEAILLKDILLGYKRMGFQLSKDKQAILKKKFKQVSKLETAFSKEIDDWRDHILLSKNDLSGLPENFLRRLKQDKKGNYIVSLDYPEIGPFLEYADSEPKRKELFEKNLTKGGKKNTTRLEKVIELRNEISTMMGYRNYVSYATEIQMSKTDTVVSRFLLDLAKKTSLKGMKDMQLLLKEKIALTGNKNSTVYLHDMSYLAGHIKRRELNIDSEKVREYFTLEKLLLGVFELYGKLFSVKFKAIPGVKLWHKEVTYYGVYSLTNELIGYFALDLFPREGKYTHMGVSGLFRGEVDYETGLYRAPFAVMLGNFTPPSKGTPATLSHSEIKTFFHEFGHLMHDVLTEAKYYSQSCTSVSTDFVEMPSQLLENWTWDKQILKKLSGHYKDPKKKIPESMLDGIIQSEKFLKGLSATRQLIYALYDYKLHEGKKIKDVNSIFNDLNKQYLGISVFKNSMMGAGFGHLMGYAAKYYSYMWSLVYSDDMFTRFKNEGLLNSKTGMDLRNEILAKGGSDDEMKLLENFLGRKPNNKAFLKALGL